MHLYIIVIVIIIIIIIITIIVTVTVTVTVIVVIVGFVLFSFSCVFLFIIIWFYIRERRNWFCEKNCTGMCIEYNRTSVESYTYVPLHLRLLDACFICWAMSPSVGWCTVGVGVGVGIGVGVGVGVSSIHNNTCTSVLLGEHHFLFLLTSIWSLIHITMLSLFFYSFIDYYVPDNTRYIFCTQDGSIVRTTTYIQYLWLPFIIFV